LKAFSLTDRIGVKPSCEVICLLDATIAAATATSSSIQLEPLSSYHRRTHTFGTHMLIPHKEYVPEVPQILEEDLEQPCNVQLRVKDYKMDKEDSCPKKRSRHSRRKEIMAPLPESWDEEDIVDVYGSEYGVDNEIAQTADIDADSDDPTWGLPIIRQVDPILDFISYYS
jgi:hypothetical protein